MFDFVLGPFSNALLACAAKVRRLMRRSGIQVPGSGADTLFVLVFERHCLAKSLEVEFEAQFFGDLLGEVVE